MLVFNDSLMNPIREFLYGNFFLGTFDHLVGRSYDIFLGTHFGVHFTTFVGEWYIDWGPLGTFIVALILPAILFHGWNNKKRIYMADLLLYTYWSFYLTNGIFALGSGYYIYWVSTFIVYAFLRILRI
jgi:hypothetical protein